MKIRLEQLGKIFPGRGKQKEQQVVALADIDLEFPDGKLIGLLGPSGCGKSTALNVISGLEAPTTGKVFFGDEDVTKLPPELRKVGLVFQNYALYPHLTIRQNILFPLQNLKGSEKLSKAEMEDRVQEAAKVVQIENLLGRRPKELSGGQQQRAAIARALVKTPNVLLLDEPLSNLDARLRIETREELRRIQQKTGVTTIFVTHDQEEAMSISDEIVVMREGRIQQVGSPQKVYDEPANEFVARFLGTPPINMFNGFIRQGRLVLGKHELLSGVNVPDGAVHIGIRPEAYVPFGKKLLVEVKRLEVMGRDTSLLFSVDGQEGVFRAIVPSKTKVNAGSILGMDIDRHKLFAFDPATGKRLI